MAARPTLVIGNRNYSSWSMRPWLLLKAFGVPFDEVLVPLGTPDFEASVREWSPSGRVPALRHGDVVVWDSLAICEYANEALLDGRGWPAAVAARAHARAIVAEMHSGMSDLRAECPMNVRRVMERPHRISPAAQRDAARVQAIWRDTRARYGAGGELLFGSFTIADAFYAPVVFRFRTYGVPVDDDARRYMDAVLALPATREWIALAEAEPQSLERYDTVGA